MINMVVYITFILLFGLFYFIGKQVAKLSYFIDFCFNEGNIFDWYYSFLLYVELFLPKLAKVLGLCNICMNFWVSTILFFTLFNKMIEGNTYLTIMVYIIFISSSVFESLKINGLVNKNSAPKITQEELKTIYKEEENV